jgi:hypothetical protein
MSSQNNCEKNNDESIPSIIYNDASCPFVSYNKEIVGAIIKIKESIKQNISNGNNFCNTYGEISKKISIATMVESDELNEDNSVKYIKITEDCTVYPESSDIQDWMVDCVKQITEYKPLNAQALENMKKKGVVPKKQPGEILIVLVIPSRTHIHVAVYIPPMYRDGFCIENFVSGAMKDTVYSIVVDNEYGFINYPHESPLKERDNVLRKFFAQLKVIGIYKDIEEEEVLYSINDDDILNSTNDTKYTYINYHC